MIGIVAVVATAVCAAGLVLFHLFPAAGQHRLARGRHRDKGETHRGYADDEESVAELVQFAVDHARTKRDGIGGS